MANAGGASLRPACPLIFRKGRRGDENFPGCQSSDDEIDQFSAPVAAQDHARINIQVPAEMNRKLPCKGLGIMGNILDVLPYYVSDRVGHTEGIDGRAEINDLAHRNARFLGSLVDVAAVLLRHRFHGKQRALFPRRWITKGRWNRIRRSVHYAISLWIKSISILSLTTAAKRSRA